MMAKQKPVIHATVSILHQSQSWPRISTSGQQKVRNISETHDVLIGEHAIRDAEADQLQRCGGLKALWIQLWHGSAAGQPQRLLPPGDGISRVALTNVIGINARTQQPPHLLNVAARHRVVQTLLRR